MPDLIQREAELEAIDAAIGAAASGEGGVLAIEGSAGIGKTSLVQAAAERARSERFLVRVARGTELERGLSFGLARQLFEPLLMDRARRAALLDGPAAGALRALGLEDPTANAQAGDELWRALHGLFWLAAGLSEEQPVLLALDDVQWADGESARWVTYMLRRVADLPLVLVAAARSDDVRPEGPLGELLADRAVRRVRLQPLDKAGTAQLVAARYDSAVSPAFVSACFDASKGNPFFLSELVSEAQDAGVAPDDDGATRIQSLTPSRIATAILVRIARVGPAAPSVAEAIAVLGRDAGVTEVAELTGSDPRVVLEIADAMRRAGVLRDLDALEFSHPIVRAAVYGEIPRGRRALLHEHAVRMLLSADAPADRVAGHVLASPPRGDDAVADRLRDAADEAMATGAPAAAATYLRRALDEPPAASSRADVLLALGQAEYRAGHLSAAAAALEQAVESYDDDGDRIAATRELTPVLVASGRTGEAIEALQAALALVPESDRELALQVEGDIGSAGLLDLEWGRQVIPGLVRFADLPGETHAERVLIGLVAYVAANACVPIDAVAPMIDRAWAGGRLLSDAPSDVTAGLLLTVILAGADRHAEASAIVDSLIARATERSVAPAFAAAAAVRSYLLYRQGALREAEHDAQSALDAGELSVLVIAVASMLDVLVERGRHDDAQTLLDRVGWDGELGEYMPFNTLLVSRGRLRAAQHRPDDARADLRELEVREGRLEQAFNPAFLPWRSALVPVLLAEDEREEAERLAADELELARRFGAPRAHGAALRARASTAPAQERLALLEEAVAVLEPSGAKLEQARTLVELGAALRRANRRADARPFLKRGRAPAAPPSAAATRSRRASCGWPAWPRTA